MRTNLKNDRFLQNKLIFQIFCFLLKEQFFNKLFKKERLLTERTILLNEQFYWTIEIHGKLTFNLRTNEINFFLNDWKKITSEKGRSRPMNDEKTKWKTPNAPISINCNCGIIGHLTQYRDQITVNKHILSSRSYANKHILSSRSYANKH